MSLLKPAWQAAETVSTSTPNDHCASHSLLIIDDDSASSKRLQLLCNRLLPKGLALFFARSPQEAREHLLTEKIHTVLLDKELKQPSGKFDNGIHLIPEIREHSPASQILVITSSRDTKDCVEAMRLGAFGFVTKENPDEVISEQILRAVEHSKFAFAKLSGESLAPETRKDLKLFSNSHRMRSLNLKLTSVAETNRPVLLLGETGTGKTTAARMIHEYRRSFLKQTDRPFLSINMGGLNPSTVERDLFGNERGAFTDAKEARPGFIELANRGTLFLDEIGEASLDLQAKLLKVLDEGTFYRLGSANERKSSFKLICATNRNLEEMIRKGSFREDLFMRISTFTIRIPSLKDQPEEIDSIVKQVLPKVCSENNVFVTFGDLPRDFIEHLKKYPPPGNIRGLEQQLSRLLVYAPKDQKSRPILTSWRSLPGIYRGSKKRKNDSIGLEELESRPMNILGENFPGIAEFTRGIEQRVIREALDSHPSLRQAAKALKMSPGGLSLKMMRLGMKAKRHD